MPVKQVMTDSETKMKKAVEVLQDEFRGVRTGRASAGLVENIKVEYYDNPTPLKALAAISTPQQDMILVKPFDPGSIKDIDRAILASDVGLTPMVDGKVIRLNVPALTEERRRQLTGQVKQMAEQAKVSVRNIRRDAIKQLEKEEKEKSITEDDLKKGQKQLDDLTKQSTDKIDQVVKHKSDEIMQG
ncbi:MAG: ribosome recycling factor [Sedimentisphaerales bacterium]|nr:ribosome recycling factor [Sedimentisphaerales bacterium]